MPGALPICKRAKIARHEWPPESLDKRTERVDGPQITDIQYGVLLQVACTCARVRVELEMRQYMNWGVFCVCFFGGYRCACRQLNL